jgi:hypothetical protein
MIPLIILYAFCFILIVIFLIERVFTIRRFIIKNKYRMFYWKEYYILIKNYTLEYDKKNLSNEDKLKIIKNYTEKQQKILDNLIKLNR